MATYSSVTCAEVEGSVRDNITLEGFEASVELRCAYADRYLLASDLLLNGRLWPHAHASVAPVVTSVSIRSEGFPDGVTPIVSDQSLIYADSVLSVKYSHTVKNLIQEEIVPKVDFQRLDHRMFKWDTSGDPLLEAEAPGKQINTIDIVRTYFLVSAIPTGVFTLLGHTNNLALTTTTLGLTFQPEQLRFNEPSISTTVSTDGTDFYTLKLPFSAHPVSWNKFWRAKTSTWEEMSLIDGGGIYKNFPPADFSSLWSIPQG